MADNAAPTPDRAVRLDGLVVDEFSGVDAPAHLVPGWLVVKSRHTQNTPHPEASMPEINLDALDPTVRAFIEDQSAELTKARDSLAYLESVAKSEDEKKDEDEDEDEDEIAKALGSLPAPIRKAFEDLTARAAAAETIAQAEQDKRLDAEFVAKAAELEHLSVKPETFGPVLRKCAEALGAEAVQLFEVLKAADAAVAESTLLTEAGSTQTRTGGDAMAQLQTLAEAMTKADPNLSPAMALTKAVEANPALYAQHLQES